MKTDALPGPGLSATPLPARLSRAAAAVAPAIAAAAGRAGIDFAALFHTARLESGFNPAAKAATSSAAGLFQFIDSSWLRMLDRHGAENGIAPLPRAQALALRNDPAIASLMAAESMAENGVALEKALGRKAGATDLYLAHFLGAGGATRFLQGLAQSPETPGAALLPAAARANRAIFYAQGAPRSLAEIHRLLAQRLGGDPIDPAALPAALRAQIAASPTGGPMAEAGSGIGAASPAADAPFAPADAARFAYLMLAEMGG